MDALGDPHRSLPDLTGLYLPHIERLRETFGPTRGCVNFGELRAALIPLVYADRGGRLFHVTDALDARLRETDIGEDTPCMFLRAPFPAVYIEFGSNRDTPYRVVNTASGDHILEGAYIFESRTVLDAGEAYAIARGKQLRDGGEYRVIDICLVGSPIGKAHVLDDSLSYFTLYVGEEHAELPVLEVVEQQLRGMEAELRGAPGFTPLFDRESPFLLVALNHLIKCLLYLQCGNRALKEDNAECALRDRIARTGSKKRAKLERRLASVYDRIVVGPERFESDAHPPSTTGTVVTHWRRGHMRRQRYGEGRRESRLIWIEPVLVNAEHLGDPAAREYEVRTD